MSVHQFLLALRARFGVFFLAVAITVLAALGASLMMSKVYVAWASLLVDSRDQQTMDGSGGGNARYQSGYLQTQVDIIQSRKVAAKVAGDLKLAERPFVQELYAKGSDGKMPMEVWLNGWLRENLMVDTSQSSVLNVGFRAKRDPEIAAELANGFAKAYMGTALELRVQPMREAASWFDEQVKELRANLERAQEKLAAAQNERGVLTAEGVDEENARYQELARQLKLAEGSGTDTGRRSADFVNTPEVQALRIEAARAESKLRELATQLGPNHPTYQRQQAEIGGLRERISQETRRAVGAGESSAAGNRARVERLRAQLADQRARVMQSRLNRTDLGVLQRDVESAQRAYDSALQRFVVNKVDSRANQTNISFLSAAVPPTQAARPKPLMNALLAGVAGAILGLALVYLLEMLDRRVRARGDLEGAFRTPVLLVLEDRPLSARRSFLPFRPEPRAALVHRT